MSFFRCRLGSRSLPEHSCMPQAQLEQLHRLQSLCRACFTAGVSVVSLTHEHCTDMIESQPPTTLPLATSCGCCTDLPSTRCQKRPSTVKTPSKPPTVAIVPRSQRRQALASTKWSHVQQPHGTAADRFCHGPDPVPPVAIIATRAPQIRAEALPNRKCRTGAEPAHRQGSCGWQYWPRGICCGLLHKSNNLASRSTM
jgi:hypothetical protein